MVNNQTCLHQHLIGQSFTYEPSQDVLYLNNAKSGCSTIKNTMLLGLRQSDEPDNQTALTAKEIHGKSNYWSEDYSRISGQSTFSFSVVRNPFTRILSAYLDKMGHDNLLRRQFYWQHGLKQDHNISLVEFLKLIKGNDSLLDQHWRPQVANLFVGFFPLDEVHFLESLSTSQSSICERLAGVETLTNQSPHGTGARTKVLEHINEEAHALIVERYKEDFEAFGYSTDLADVGDAPSGGVLSLSADTAVLTDMLAHMTTPKSVGKNFRLSLHALGIADISQNIALKHTAIWRDQVAQAATSASPAERYIAQSIVFGPGSPYFDADFVMQSLIGIVQIAPYNISNHAHLIKCLANSGRFDEAKSRAKTLKGMTWRKAMVDGLLETVTDMEERVASGADLEKTVALGTYSRVKALVRRILR